MSSAVGSIGWHDLTVANADQVRDFYSAVVGWKSQPVGMGGYNDYCMNSPDNGETAAGVCHARGANADMPAQWLIYINVADVAKSAEKCCELGGQIVVPIRSMGGGLCCVIRDPAGAVCALFQQESG
jgi:predicted enzyme related to lactoylglutathione lyase